MTLSPDDTARLREQLTSGCLQFPKILARQWDVQVRVIERLMRQLGQPFPSTATPTRKESIDEQRTEQ